MIEAEQPLDAKVEWVPLSHVITAEVLALTYLWRELDSIVRNQPPGDCLRPTALAPFIEELRDLQQKIMAGLGQEHGVTPTFRLGWQRSKVRLSPVSHSLMDLGEQYGSPCLILGNTRQAGDTYEEVNFAFVQTDARGWEPFATNPHGLMAVVVVHYSSQLCQTSLNVITEPLLRLRNG